MAKETKFDFLPMFVIFCKKSILVHIPFVVNHTINTTPPERLQQHPLLLTTNHTDRTFFVWRLTLPRPSHPGHSTILLRSEILSGMCTKLCTVAASNNRDHLTRSLYYCLFGPHTYIFVLRAHPIRGESHNQRNTTGEVATVPNDLGQKGLNLCHLGPPPKKKNFSIF